MATRTLEIAGFSVILGCFALLLGTHLDVSPGLHGDEAWFGLRAEQMRSGADTSLHGMNAYSGALFPLVVAGSFRLSGVSAWSLRFPGAACNLMAIGLLALQVWRLRQRVVGAILLLLLLAGSVLVTAESRVAWEVTALGPLFAALLLALALRILKRADPTRREGLDATAFVVVAALGTYSHFIFLSLVAGLFVSSFACAVRFPEFRTRSLLVVTTGALANAAALAILKMRLFAAHQSDPAFAVPCALAIGLQAAAFPGLRRWLDERLRVTLARAATPWRRLEPAAALVGAAAFGAVHLPAFIQTVSNDVVLKRLYSVSMPWPLLGLSYAYALLLVGAYVTVLVRVLRGSTRVGPPDFFLIVLPVPVAAALPIMVHPRSIRYYVLANLVLMVALAVSHAHVTRVQAARFIRIVFGYAIAVNAVLIPIIADRHHYDSVSPMWFALGLRPETSAHFFPTAPVVDRLRADAVREFDTREAFFIGRPLEFYLSFQNWKASPGRRAAVDYDYGLRGGILYRVFDEPARAQR
jgi:hypothetical protein